MDRTPPAPQPRILEDNLHALRAVDPATADCQAALDLAPLNPVPARTRDGRLSFRLTQPDGKTGWLGRTSVPGVRAAALLEQFDPGNGNVLLPSFGEGTEVQTLLSQLQPHRVVFVWEPDPVTIRLALSLHDFSAALRAGRLVILYCAAENLTQALANWLQNHSAQECPGRLMMWPWQTDAQIDQIRSAVEAAWREATRQG